MNIAQTTQETLGLMKEFARQDRHGVDRPHRL